MVEFCRLFATGLATENLNTLTLETLEAAVLARSQPHKIGKVLASLLISLMEVTEGPNSTEVSQIKYWPSSSVDCLVHVLSPVLR